MEQTLYRKYRPQTFADLASQEHVKQTIQNQLKSGRVAHAYLFTGPRGVGKTTTARLMAKAVNCEKPEGTVEPCNACAACQAITSGSSLDVYEIDAASHTGVDNVRENIIESVRFAPNLLKFKVYIIDEVHMLSTSAFNALLKTLEEPPAHALFILATTEIHKVPATIVSRCQRFDFRRIPAKEIVSRLKDICKAEKVIVNDDVLFEIARNAEGGARDAESLLGQLLALGEKKIGVEEASLVMPMTQTPAVLAFLTRLSQRDAAATVAFLNEFVEEGGEMNAFLDAIVHMLRSILFAKLGGLESHAEEFDKETSAKVLEFSGAWSTAELTEAIEAFLDAKRHAKSDAIPQLAAELAVVKLTTDRHPEQTPAEPAEAEGSLRSGPRQASGRDDEASDFSEQEIASVAPLPRNNKETFSAQEAGLSRTDESPTVLGGVPLLSLDEVKAKWPEVFEKIQSCHASLPLVMQAGQIGGVHEGVVELRFEYALHAETVNRAKNKQLVEGILGEVLGKNVRVNAVHTPAGAANDETVSSLLQEFGGQAV